MKKISDIISKPSEAIIAMKNGLLNQSKRSDFKINMNTFGRVDDSGKICFGCAALCTVQELTKTNFDVSNVSGRYYRALATDVDSEDMRAFEYAINQARLGYMSCLFFYLNIEKTNKYDHIIDLDSKWKDQLPKIDKLIFLLQQDNL